MSSFFIRRPIVAIVIAILTTLIGAISILELPIAQFPNVIPPQIQVTAQYVGADALTVEESVATPIEQQMSGVEGMEYMYSVNASNGQMQLNVFFEIGTQPNTDQILAQLRQSQASSQLPTPVNQQGVVVQQSYSSPLLVYSIYSPKGTYDSIFLANYAYINLKYALTRVKGVGSVAIYGAGQYAMRIWVDPDLMAKLNVTVPEVVNAIQQQNTVNPAGQIGAEPSPKGVSFTYTVRTTGRLVTEEEFGDIIVRANQNGSLIRVKDVARVELGAQSYNLEGRYQGQPAAVISISQQPGSNAIATANSVRKLMADLSKNFPEDLEYTTSLDTTLAITSSMEEIVHTIIEAIILVVIVVFVFLQGWRATLIPLIAIPVSLVGTFMFFPLIGFTLNTLSLFGLVLAIGLVVDDAIVVVEAVEHNIEKGLSPRDATEQAMKEVQGPVIATALIMAAVFLPTLFLPGMTGQMYQQFAVTIAISVIISAFNALSLSPALSSMLLRPRKEAKGILGRAFGGFNRVFGYATNKYVNACRMLIRRGVLAVALLLIISGVVGGLGKSLPSGFIPEEDQGYIFGFVQLPKASSLQRTRAVSQEVEKGLENLKGVKNVSSVVGFNLLSTVQSTYSAFFFINFEPWDERQTPETSASAILEKASEIIGQVPGAVGFAFPPPAIPGVGTSGGITLMLEDRTGRSVEFLAEQTNKFIEAVQKRPEFANAATVWIPDTPQVYIDVLESKALKQGVQLSDIYQTMQAFMGGSFVNFFNRFGQQWQTYVSAQSDFRSGMNNIGEFFVRNSDGKSIPLSSMIQIKRITGPEFTMRFNMYRSVQINAVPAKGYSAGQAMAAIEEVFNETMPPGMGYDYSGMSYQAKVAAEGISINTIFAISLIFVFLILAAQYESWSLPFSVLLCTPVAVLGAFLALKFRVMELNLYVQIGLIMLIGLSAKNSILIVEFAKQEFEKGATLFEAALKGAEIRLRPILMTSFAFILGCVPLWRASGSGAISRQNLGTTVIGGMLAASFIAIFLVPFTFYIIEKLSG
ncbi:MAG: efflux RND transporter permease subunit, partial [Chthoniobacterales bacterium]